MPDCRATRLLVAAADSMPWELTQAEPESSPSIARFAARQLRMLPALATQVAHALGVLGDDVGSDELARVTGAARQDVLDARRLQ